MTERRSSIPGSIRPESVAHYQIGQPPGTLYADPAAVPSIIRWMVYDKNEVREDQLRHPTDEVQLDANPNQVLWLDVVGLGSLDALQRLGEQFGLHPLALADVLHQQQRPKAEAYGNTLFVVMRIPHVREGWVEFEQVSLFLGKGFVLTFQQDEEDCFGPIRDRIRQRRGKVRDAGADYLAYTLVDAVLDEYFPLIDAISGHIDSMEREVVSSSAPNVVERLLDIKGDINQVRRNIVPARDAVAALGSIAGNLVSDETKLYLRDCQDHILQMHDYTESYRETVATLIEVHLNMTGQRLNEIMKVLTIIATVFMPLGFIAGVYGMNFNPEASPYNMPELGWKWGYPAVLSLMLLIAAGLFWFFWQRGWLKGRH